MLYAGLSSNWTYNYWYMRRCAKYRYDQDDKVAEFFGLVIDEKVALSNIIGTELFKHLSQFFDLH